MYVVNGPPKKMPELLRPTRAAVSGQDGTRDIPAPSLQTQGILVVALRVSSALPARRQGEERASYL
jgi:hypothetical protein